MLDALIVSPHPEDAELGVGGTIVRLISEGWNVGILDLTSGEPTPLGSVERRKAETAEANAVLGNPWRQNLGLPNRSLEPSLVGGVSRGSSTIDLRPLLGRRPPRPSGRDKAR